MICADVAANSATARDDAGYLPAATEDAWDELPEELRAAAAELGYTQPVWDGEEEEVPTNGAEKLKLEQAKYDEWAVAKEACNPARAVCMLSNILCYCTDDETADLFLELLSPGGGAPPTCSPPLMVVSCTRVADR